MKKEFAPLVHWLVPGDFSDNQSLICCNLASIRLRLGVALPFLKKNGFKVNAGDRILERPSLIVIGKIGAGDLQYRYGLWVEQIERLKLEGDVLIALDYTDNHLEFESSMTPFYQRIFPLVDYYISPTNYLSESLNRRQARPTFIIDDGLEYTCIDPRTLNSNQRLRILWFGHESNLHYLMELLNSPILRDNSYEIMIVSGPKAPQLLSKTKLDKNFQSKIFYTPWSVETLAKVSESCQLCVIPGNPYDPRKAGASSNRLLTALTLGLPTAADCIDSYKRFQDFFIDIRGPQFKELFENPTRFHSKVREAQRSIVPQFHAENIGKRWVQCIDSIIDCKNSTIKTR
jgi:hypothetical protein